MQNESPIRLFESRGQIWDMTLPDAVVDWLCRDPEMGLTLASSSSSARHDHLLEGFILESLEYIYVYKLFVKN